MESRTQRDFGLHNAGFLTDLIFSYSSEKFYLKSINIIFFSRLLLLLRFSFRLKDQVLYLYKFTCKMLRLRV
jgi:hypothetical protein